MFENIDLYHLILSELLEEIAFSKAIEVGDKTNIISKKEIYDILN